MKPEQIAKSGTESAEQKALFAWCALNTNVYPELIWFHAIPNGGSRGDDARVRAIRGNTLKAEGVREGVSDTFLPTARYNVQKYLLHGLYIEMKRTCLKPKREGSKGGASDEQIEFGRHVISQGYAFAICYGWEEARDILISYLKGEFMQKSY